MTEFAKPSEQSAKSDGAPFGKRYQETIPPFNADKKIKEQEDIEKYGPIVFPSSLVIDDEKKKLEQLHQELRTYKSRNSIPGPEQLNGALLAGAPDPIIVKELEDDIAAVMLRAKEERVMIQNLNLDDKYRNDALGDLYHAKELLVAEINQPNSSSRQAENKRRLATANRLIAKIEKAHGSPKKPTDDEDSIKKEQMPAGRTQEQIEAEESKKRREEEEYQKRIDESWEQKRQAEQQQREENERQQQARQKAETERQERIRAQREQVINAARNTAKQEQVEEEEMEMEM